MLGLTGFLEQRVLDYLLNLKAAFKGTSLRTVSKDTRTKDKGRPLSLYIAAHYTSSIKELALKTTFNINSLYYFPSSLGFARKSIYQLPKATSALNFTQNIYLSIETL